MKPPKSLKELLQIARKGESDTVLLLEHPGQGNHLLYDAIAAMHNTTGGMVLVGIGKDGLLRGLSQDCVREIKAGLLPQRFFPPLPGCSAEHIPLENLTFISVISVEPGIVSPVANPLTGLFPVRIKRARDGQRVYDIYSYTFTEIAERFWGRAIPYSQMPLHHCPYPESVDLERAGILLRSVNAARQDSGILEIFSTQGDFMPFAGKRVKEFCDLGFVMRVRGKNYLTIAGALFLMHRPQDKIPHAYISFRDSPGQHPCVIDGPVQAMLLKAIQSLAPHISHLNFEARNGIIGAFTQAVVNAITHRDYAAREPIQISVFPGESVVIRNPCSLSADAFALARSGRSLIGNAPIHNAMRILKLATGQLHGTGLARIRRAADVYIHKEAKIGLEYVSGQQHPYFVVQIPLS